MEISKTARGARILSKQSGGLLRMALTESPYHTSRYHRYSTVVEIGDHATHDFVIQRKMLKEQLRSVSAQ